MKAYLHSEYYTLWCSVNFFCQNKDILIQCFFASHLKWIWKVLQINRIYSLQFTPEFLLLSWLPLSVPFHLPRFQLTVKITTTRWSSELSSMNNLFITSKGRKRNFFLTITLQPVSVMVVGAAAGPVVVSLSDLEILFFSCRHWAVLNMAQ